MSSGGLAAGGVAAWFTTVRGRRGGGGYSGPFGIMIFDMV